MSTDFKPTFASGELSPSLHTRPDLAKYGAGLALCDNFIIHAQGGASNRPGLRFIGESRSSTTTRLIPFQFNVEASFALEFTANEIRIISGGAYVTDGTNIIVVPTPYTEPELFDLYYTQSADVMTIVHPNHPVHEFKRFANDDWQLVEVSYAVTATPPSGVTVSAGGLGAGDYDKEYEYVVTAVGTDGFESEPSPVASITTKSLSQTAYNDVSWSGGSVGGDVIATFNVINEQPYGGRIFGPSSKTAYETQNLIIKVYGFGIEVDQIDQAVFSNGSITETVVPGGELILPVRASVAGQQVSLRITDVISGSVINMVVTIAQSSTGTAVERYNVYKAESAGSGVYGWIGDTKTASYRDYNIAPLMGTPPPSYNNPFEADYPSTVSYYQQRVLFASTDDKPQTLFATTTGQYGNFKRSLPTVDDDMIEATVASSQVNKIRHIVSLQQLVLLTSGGEWIVTEGENKVLTPSTTGFRQQSYIGSSKVKPVIIGNTALFIQEKGSAVFDLGYRFESDSYAGSELSIMAEHLFRDHEIIDWAYARNPDSIVWCVRDDGVMLGLTYNREQNVWAWHQHHTNGQFKSVVAVSEGDRDAIYAVVERQVGGSAKHYIERMEKQERTSNTDAFYVDSGLSYNGAETAVVTGLDHLEGMTVTALADGNVVDQLVVSGGSVTLPRAASVIHVGLPYTSTMRDLPFDAQTQSGSTRGHTKHLGAVTLSLLTSRGVWVGTSLEDMVEAKPRIKQDSYGPIGLRTEEHQVTQTVGWGRTGQLYYQQRDPLPTHIIGIAKEIQLGGS